MPAPASHGQERFQRYSAIWLQPRCAVIAIKTATTAITPSFISRTSHLRPRGFSASAATGAVLAGRSDGMTGRGITTGGTIGCQPYDPALRARISFRPSSPAICRLTRGPLHDKNWAIRFDSHPLWVA